MRRVSAALLLLLLLLPAAAFGEEAVFRLDTPYTDLLGLSSGSSLSDPRARAQFCALLAIDLYGAGVDVTPALSGEGRIYCGRSQSGPTAVFYQTDSTVAVGISESGAWYGLLPAITDLDAAGAVTERIGWEDAAEIDDALLDEVLESVRIAVGA